MKISNADMTRIIIKIAKLLNQILTLIIKTYDNMFNLLYLKINQVEYTNFPKIEGRILIQNRGRIQIGERVIINSSVKSNPIGGEGKTVIVCSKNARIKIGNQTGISNSCIYSRGEIQIGNNVLIGGGCKIYDTDFHNLDYRLRTLDGEESGISVKPVNIKDHVFIGAHSIILKGVTIGEKSIIGAGSVVTKNVPSNEIWAGNPARRIRSIS